MGDDGSAPEPTMSEEEGRPDGDADQTGAGMEGGNDQSASSEPGFGEVAGAEALPDMTDTLPSFEESMGKGDQSGENGSEDGQPSSSGDGSGGQIAGQSATAGSGGDTAETGGYTQGGYASEGAASTPGTRTEGGMEGMGGANGTLTTAEQVAILDRQLEQSTSDFDTMILEEQQRQRELERERAARQADREQPESAGAGTGGRSPYQDDVAMGGGSTGGGMGGASGAGGGIGRPDNPAVYKPPADIPQGNDDDVVARQLREAAMREPDPEVRKKLWDEYRKYKGLEIPEE